MSARTTILAALLLAAGCHSDPEPVETAAQAVEMPATVFRFETGRDPASRALAEAVAISQALPTTEPELQDLTARRAANVADRAALAEDIVPILIAELRGRDPAERLVFQKVFELLADTGRDPAAAYLAHWVQLERPARLDPDAHDDPRSYLIATQAIAVGALATMSARGNPIARTAILDTAAADPALRELAVRGYYLGRGDRFRAKRELLARLPADARHLAHQIVTP